MKTRPQKHNNPLTTLAEHIKNDDFESFVKLYTLLRENADLMQFNLNQTVNHLMLQQHAIKYNRQRHFEFLLENDHPVLKKYAAATFTAQLVDLVGEDTERFLYWLNILWKHRDLFHLDLNKEVSGLTLLQHAAIKNPDPEILNTLIDMDCVIIADAGPFVDRRNRDRRIEANRVLVQTDGIMMPTAIIGNLLIHYTHLNALDEIKALHLKTDAINYTDIHGRTALSYAADVGRKEIVDYLLAHGAHPFGAIEFALNRWHDEIVRTLLRHGAGLWQDLPKLLIDRGINANGCYIEGMTLDGAEITSKTEGFHEAIFTSKELAELKHKQDQMQSSAAELPLHAIKNALLHLHAQDEKDENIALLNALERLEDESIVYSLKSQAKKVIQIDPAASKIKIKVAHTDPEDGIVVISSKTLNAAQYLAQLSPELSDMVLGTNHPHAETVRIVEERLDELLDFYQHMSSMKDDKEAAKKLAAHFGAAGLHTAYATPLLYGTYAGTTFLCCSKPLPCIYQNAMAVFGIPGFVAAGITTIATLLTLNFVRQYGWDEGLCCGSNIAEPVIGNQPELTATINALVELTKDEHLPDYVTHALNQMSGDSQADLTYTQLLKLLDVIRTYYNDTELARVQENRSQTPLGNFKPGLFYWSNEQLMTYREANQPPVMQMVDDPIEGSFVFPERSRAAERMIRMTDAKRLFENESAPQQLRMESEGESEESESNEEQPLLNGQQPY